MTYVFPLSPELLPYAELIRGSFIFLAMVLEFCAAYYLSHKDPGRFFSISIVAMVSFMWFIHL